MGNIYMWGEPWKSSKMDTTFAQGAGRSCGPDKEKHGTILVTSMKAIQEIVVSYKEFQDTQDLQALAIRTSHIHKVRKDKMKGVYKSFLANADDERLETSIVDRVKGGWLEKKPLALSGRGVEAGKTQSLSPDELILQALAEPMGKTIGLTAFPLAYGSPGKTCKWDGQKSYGILLDGPSPNCPPELKSKIEAMKDKYFIQTFAYETKAKALGGSIKEMPPSKKKGTLFSSYEQGASLG